MLRQNGFEYDKLSFGSRFTELAVRLALCLAAILALAVLAQAQTETTGSFQGSVSNKSGAPIPGAAIEIKNVESGVQRSRASDKDGKFVESLLGPGEYEITISAQGYKSRTLREIVYATQPNQIIPLPVTLEPEMVAEATPAPTPTGSPQPIATASPTPRPAPSVEGISSEPINTTDARRNGAFTMDQVEALPLGGTTLTRSFDELALLLPGVAPPPETQGGVSGPGVGPGVGSAGQFAVNGMRSRANNFTVDGSDNNDEDIGVRRQGFFALIPQPIESIKEFQIITLLAPAQYGRNVGSQVNAISKSGGIGTMHGSFYGFLNTSQLNAPNFFDTTSGNFISPLRSGNKAVLDCTNSNFSGGFCTTANGGVPITTSFNAGKKDSFTLGQGGGVIGGTLVPGKLFYFVSLEGQLLNAVKETHFAVPTVKQRGAFNSGDTGLSVNPLTGAQTFAFPTSAAGDAIISFFPFPNNPNGPYGANTFTEVVSASAQSKIASGKIDSNFKAFGKQHSFTARYNFTQDWRDIPAVGGALFARLRPRVRTQNFSTYLNTPELTNRASNQLRLSYGRTRLIFDEGRDTDFLLPVNRRFNDPTQAQFLLNRPLLANATLPGDPTVSYQRFGTTEGQIGPVGQVIIAGFSPVGVDVFNFPQRRVNNTYQLADTLTFHVGRHNFAFGTDNRRTELNSSLPRNARPLMTFNGAPRLVVTADANGNLSFRFPRTGDPNPFVSGLDFAAAGAPSGFFQTLVQSGSDSNIHLRYYQFNFFGQDEWRVRSNLSISYGLRYEYNTPPKESARRIENTFSSSALSLVPGLRNFIDGRTRIFEADRNNFAPRVGFAYSSHRFGSDRTTLVRAGYGIYYDQILGSVVSQSRNVFPTFSTINFGGGCNTGCGDILGVGSALAFNIFNPMRTTYFVSGLGQVPIVLPGTLNTLNPAITLDNLVTTTNKYFGNLFDTPGNSAFGATLPKRRLQTPMAHQYSLTIEQQLNSQIVVSAAYVGTSGRNLLRFTSPNLGPNSLLAPLLVGVDPNTLSPIFLGVTVPPGTRFTTAGDLTGGRPTKNVGAVNIFETSAKSRYDSLQVQVRGRMKLLGTSSSYQVSYTFSSAKDDVSDVFDLVGASALPQDSVTFAGEYAPANFDARHRIAYSYVSDPPHFKNRTVQAILGNIQMAGTGQFQTGQPFTINSIFDVNLDGNLTDRLNSTNGIVSTGDRSQPFRLTVDPATLLAPIGQDGQVPRNSFRSTNLLLDNLAVIKTIPFSERYKLTFRTEIFNVFNRANFGLPVRFLEAPSFGKSTNTVTPGRRIQFALKFSF